MKYDDASWHYGADNFPKDLAEVSGATHTGMFVAWALLSGLAGSIHIEEFSDDIPKLVNRSVTPAAFFLKPATESSRMKTSTKRAIGLQETTSSSRGASTWRTTSQLSVKRAVIFTMSKIVGRTSIVSSRSSTGAMPTGRRAMANKAIEQSDRVRAHWAPDSQEPVAFVRGSSLAVGVYDSSPHIHKFSLRCDRGEAESHQSHCRRRHSELAEGTASKRRVLGYSAGARRLGLVHLRQRPGKFISCRGEF